jgi:hypothetical protein
VQGRAHTHTHTYIHTHLIAASTLCISDLSNQNIIWPSSCVFRRHRRSRNLERAESWYGSYLMTCSVQEEAAKRERTACKPQGLAPDLRKLQHVQLQLGVIQLFQAGNSKRANLTQTSQEETKAKQRCTKQQKGSIASYGVATTQRNAMAHLWVWKVKIQQLSTQRSMSVTGTHTLTNAHES